MAGDKVVMATNDDIMFRLGQMQGQVTGIASDVAEVKTDVKRINGTVGNNTRRIDALEAGAASMYAQVTPLVATALGKSTVHASDVARWKLLLAGATGVTVILGALGGVWSLVEHLRAVLSV